MLLLFTAVDPGSERGDGGELATEAGAGASIPSERRYSDEELGIDEVWQELVTPRYARFRSERDASEHNRFEMRYLAEEAIGHERERMHFEHNLAVVYWSAYDELPADLGEGGVLDQAFEEAMNECARARGWPGLKPNITAKADVDKAVEEFGLTHESFRDLRHECSKVAASYPTLDPAVRDELLGRLREHYRAAVHEYLREFPDAEVPLVDHPGAPRPYEDLLVWICQKDPEPMACAADSRVELPPE